MSRPLIPKPPGTDSGMSSPQASQKPRKISTACGACKQRKTRCTGSTPCDACAQRGSTCAYDVASDQRRKIANQRNLQDLNQAHTMLERYQQLCGGIVAILRAGDLIATQDLLASIRSRIDLSQLAAHVRNARRADPDIEMAYSMINLNNLDADDELASPTQLLHNMPVRTSQSSTARGSFSSRSTSAGRDIRGMSAYFRSNRYQDLMDGDMRDGQTPDGGMQDGGMQDGGMQDGDMPDGETPDNDMRDGHMPDGDTADDDMPDGDMPDGDMPDGHVPDGHTPDGDTGSRTDAVHSSRLHERHDHNR